MKRSIVTSLLLLASCSANAPPVATAPPPAAEGFAALDAPPYALPATAHAWTLADTGGAEPSDAPPQPPPREPLVPKRLSEIEAMTPAEIVKWMGSAAPHDPVRKVEIDGNPQDPTIWLLGYPQFNPELGVCSLWGWPMRFDVVNDGKSRKGDPLIRPMGTGAAERHRPGWRASDCDVDLPYAQWTDARTPETYAAGFHILREAISTVGSGERTPLPIECVDEVIPPSHDCDSPGRLLATLRPLTAKAIWEAVWSLDATAIRAKPSDAAWEINFAAPSPSAAHYTVVVKGLERPVAVQVIRCAPRNESAAACPRTERRQ